MDFSLSTGALNTLTDHTLIVAVPSEGDLPSATQQINQDFGGIIDTLLQQKDFSGKAGSTLLLPSVNGTRMILMGIGKDAIKGKDWIKSVKAAATCLKNSASDKGAITLHGLSFDDVDEAWAHQQLAQCFEDALYEFKECKSKPKEGEEDESKTIETLTVIADPAMETALQQGKAIAVGMALCKTLGNLPGNIATPSFLAETAVSLAEQYDKLAVDVLEEDRMEELGMGSFLSVSAGSIEPGKLICLNYTGGKKGDAPHVLVGKGITFDTGGISLKPGAGMDEMKYDMCGAASVLGTLKTLCALNLPINVVGVIAAAENMPAGHATKPGDIVTAMNGTTIEILNTDAEGRLVLCDALTYAIDTFKPASIVDIATLTGACMMALGGVNSGLMTQDEALAEEIQSAAELSRDAVWRLPLQEEYQELLDSNFADIANIGGRLAGATTAACFLSRFTEGQKWAHLDIAGTAWFSGGKNKGSSGRPVPLLVTYLMGKE